MPGKLPLYEQQLNFINIPKLHIFKRTGSFVLQACLSIMPAAGAFSNDTNYFQQEVNFSINVILDDRSHLIRASARIEYINNSTDTLNLLYFHLWPNAYSGNNTTLARQLISSGGRQRLFRNNEDKGFIDSLDFTIDERKVKWSLVPGKPDICRIELDSPAGPGDTLIICTPFRVKIPAGIVSRLGHTGQSYHISQWFPKPAVYDREGWHPMEYTDQGEYYSEFGKYVVSLRVPEGYIVAATGRPEDGDGQAAGGMKTFTFVQENTHDFAWFADREFLTEESTMQLPSGREILIKVMYHGAYADLWSGALQSARDALTYFSGLLGDYPYDTFTAVEGSLGAGVGMEYPGITLIGTVSDMYDLDEVISHEVCHNWFYAAVGSNERKYPFMDEGITTAYEKRYMHQKYPARKAWQFYFRKEKIARFFDMDDLTLKNIHELEWLSRARRNLDMPAGLPSSAYNSSQYVSIIYGKAATSFDYLRAFLGDQVFDSIMRSYYNEWKFKHPQPSDLRNAFESSTGKDLGWFFEDLIGTSKGIDYKLARMSGDSLLVKNRREIASPLNIAAMNGNSVVLDEWHEGFTGRKWIKVPESGSGSLKIDPFHHMQELIRTNNNYSAGAVFPKADRPDLQFYFKLEDPEKISVMYLPAPNWSREDGFMAGMAFYNGLVLPERMEYLIIPFYSFRDKKIEGYGQVSFNLAPGAGLIRYAKVIFDATRFGAPFSGQYMKFRAGSEVHFRKTRMSRPYEHSLNFFYTAASDLSLITSGGESRMRSYVQAGYEYERSGAHDPFLLKAGIESARTFHKAAASFSYRYKYYRKNSGLDLRLYSGIMLREDPGTSVYSFSPAGRSGRELYLYTGVFPDRFSMPGSNFWSKQMAFTEGSLVSPLNDTLGFSRWLISFSAASNLPWVFSRLPFRPFLNVVMDNGRTALKERPALLYEAGIIAGIRNLFEIYIPVAVSPYIDSIWQFRERIRFVLTLNAPLSLQTE